MGEKALHEKGFSAPGRAAHTAGKRIFPSNVHVYDVDAGAAARNNQPFFYNRLPAEVLEKRLSVISVSGGRRTAAHSGAVWKKKFQKSCLKPIFNEKQIFKRILSLRSVKQETESLGAISYE